MRADAVADGECRLLSCPWRRVWVGREKSRPVSVTLTRGPQRKALRTFDLPPAAWPLIPILRNRRKLPETKGPGRPGAALRDRLLSLRQ